MPFAPGQAFPESREGGLGYRLRFGERGQFGPSPDPIYELLVLHALTFLYHVPSPYPAFSRICPKAAQNEGGGVIALMDETRCS